MYFDLSTLAETVAVDEGNIQAPDAKVAGIHHMVNFNAGVKKLGFKNTAQLISQTRKADPDYDKRLSQLSTPAGKNQLQQRFREKDTLNHPMLRKMAGY